MKGLNYLVGILLAATGMWEPVRDTQIGQRFRWSQEGQKKVQVVTGRSEGGPGGHRKVRRRSR